MRIRVVFLLQKKGAVLPFHHQKNISTLLSEVMGKEHLPEEEFFSFSGLKGQTKVGREGLHYFSKRVTIVLTALHHELLEDFIQKLFQRENVYLGNLILSPEYVEEEEEPSFSDNCHYLCISPMVLLNTTDNYKNKEFVHPTADRFSDLLYESTLGRMERSGLYTDDQLTSFFKFQIVPDKPYLERVEQSEKKFARIYTVLNYGRICEARGYTLPFRLYAHPEVQRFVFKAGFGELCHRGFGMLDMYSDTPPTRKIIHQLKDVKTERAAAGTAANRSTNGFSKRSRVSN